MAEDDEDVAQLPELQFAVDRAAFEYHCDSDPEDAVDIEMEGSGLQCSGELLFDNQDDSLVVPDSQGFGSSVTASMNLSAQQDPYPVGGADLADSILQDMMIGDIEPGQGDVHVANGGEDTAESEEVTEDESTFTSVDNTRNPEQLNTIIETQDGFRW